MKAGKRLIICFIAMAIAASVFVRWIFPKAQESQGSLAADNVHELSYQSFRNDQVQGVSVLLPEDFASERYLLFKTTHTKVEVLTDDEVIYRYGWEEDAPAFLKSPGTLWHVVRVPENSGGAILMIRLYSVYEDYFGNTIVLKYGSRGECILSLIQDFWLVLVLNGIIIFAGFLSILLHFTTKKRGRVHEIGSFMCVGFLAMIIAVWSLCQSGFLQFLIPDGRSLYFVDLFSFFLFPVPFNLFIYDICKTRYGKGFAALAGAYLVNMFLAVLIQLFGGWDIFEMIKVTHGLMALNVWYVFWAINKEVKLSGSVMARRFQGPLYIVILFALAELVAYYVNALRKTSIFLPVGTLVFICSLIWIQVSQYYRSQMEAEKLMYFERLANIDMLTEAMNRNAYENTLKGMDKGKETGGSYCVVMFDVNDMKYINDNFGHEKGDEALRLCHQCICEIFGRMGQCYRIGGDEFVLLSEEGKALEAAISRFEKLVEEKAETLDFPFSVALGYAHYSADEDEDFKSTIRRSDEMMYLDKKKKKKY